LTINIRSKSSRRIVPTKRSAIAFARGARTGVLMMVMSAASRTASVGTFRQRTELTPAANKILDALGLPEPRRIYEATPATP